MQKHGIVLIMNVQERKFRQMLGFMALFLKGKIDPGNIRIMRHRNMGFFLIRFGEIPGFSIFKLAVGFLKLTRSKNKKPDVRGFWSAPDGDSDFPSDLRGKNLMLYENGNAGDLNSLNLVSEDGISYSLNTSRNEFTRLPQPKLNYLKIDLNEADFDSFPVDMKISPFALLDRLPRPFRLALYLFIAFFTGMLLLSLILSFF